MGPGGSRVSVGAPIARGTVVLVPFPFTDLSGAKQRPALVVSPPGFHAVDLILCAITSQVPPQLSRWEVALGSSDVQGQRLPKPSIVRVGKLFAMHRTLIRGRYGQVTEAKLREVLARLLELFS